MQEYSSEALYTIGENETCLTVLWENTRRRPQTVLYSRPRKFEWVDVRADEFLREVYDVAKGLIANGVGQGDRVVLMSDTRYEWNLFDFAIMAAGAVSVPVYPSSSTSQCEWIVEDSGAVIGIAEKSGHATRLNTFVHATAPAEGAHLDRVLSITDGAVETLTAEGKDISDEEVEARIAATKSSDVASLVYTSGTTGRPKGCRLLHSNWLGEARALLTHPIGGIAVEGNRALTFLPLAHVLSRAVSLASTLGGATQSHWSEMATLVPEFARAQPHLILGVPRVFEKVHAGVKSKAVDGGGIGAKIFPLAEKTAVEYSKALDTKQGPGALLKAKRAVFDKLVYGKVRAAMGGSLQYCISGGSALNSELMHFFRGIGVRIYEGYGMTETTAAIAVNFEPDNIIGTVGKPVGGNTVRIAEDGEILMKGTVVFDGYWNNEEATKDTFDGDGFLRSGDLGALLPTGHLKITGRKKEIIVTAGGKNVSPGPLEDILRSAPLISQAMVVGDDQKFIGSLITLDEDALPAWKKRNNVPEHTGVLELAKNPVLRAEIQDAINEANETVSHAEGIKKFRICARDFTEEDGEMTPSMKVKRFVVSQHFADDIAWIYNSH
ncbi:acyl-CoA synthetase [Corynebacterium variabile DSM 44702]|uniref:Acyl-CoA synthetase n=1 Tax=Corynebacterium variabile (strain DSM 44702 / CIP 107183 / JCM 12073 / NCIMB 30131) TaxID=858619 RepID=G0HDT9_CORVD|nr:long-chain fatty acid--CoA ligase [Corynebacterium variabile]AEK36407.1 acyl-CoA synthetase [Corynebacterium variabile DSM 44702]